MTDSARRIVRRSGCLSPTCSTYSVTMSSLSLFVSHLSHSPTPPTFNAAPPPHPTATPHALEILSPCLRPGNNLLPNQIIKTIATSQTSTASSVTLERELLCTLPPVVLPAYNVSDNPPASPLRFCRSLCLGGFKRIKERKGEIWVTDPQ